MNPAPFVSVVVPARNALATLGNCLNSILKGEYPPQRREIVVVHTPSRDRTADLIARFPVRCVTEPRRGLAHARNRGIAAARGDVVAFLDADCYASRSWLAELMRGFADDRIAAVAGEVVAFPPRTAVERYTAVRKPLWLEWVRCRRRPWFLFGNAAVRREALERVGGFDPRFKGGSEDIDYCWRFAEAGFHVAYSRKAIALHRHRTTKRELFRQHLGYGRGQAALCQKYPGQLRWGWEEELAAWHDLGRSAASAARAWARTNGHPRAMEYPHLDLVRKLGQRFGFVRGMLESKMSHLLER